LARRAIGHEHRGAIKDDRAQVTKAGNDRPRESGGHQRTEPKEHHADNIDPETPASVATQGGRSSFGRSERSAAGGLALGQHHQLVWGRQWLWRDPRATSGLSLPGSTRIGSGREPSSADRILSGRPTQ
jgi:hypothetical protein